MCGLERKPDADRVGKIEPVRHRMTEERRYRDALDIAAVLDRAEHVLADAEFSNGGSDRADNAGDFLARAKRKWRQI